MDERKQEISAAVGGRIKHFRRLRDFSQEEVALQAGLNPAYFGQVERGLKCPTVDTLYKIAAALSVPLPELVRVNVPTPPDVSADGLPMSFERQVSALAARVPGEKQAQFCKVMASVVDLL